MRPRRKSRSDPEQPAADPNKQVADPNKPIAEPEQPAADPNKQIAEPEQPAADQGTPSSNQGEWAGIIGSVTAPIGFFSLALLVIEAPFPVLFGLSERTHNEFKWTIIVMSLLIVTVVVIVAILTWKVPKNLIERIADKTVEKITASPDVMRAFADRVRGMEPPV